MTFPTPHDVAVYDQTLAGLNRNLTQLADSMRAVADVDGWMQASADMTAFLVAEAADANGKNPAGYMPTPAEASLIGITVAALQRIAQPPSV